MNTEFDNIVDAAKLFGTQIKEAKAKKVLSDPDMETNKAFVSDRKIPTYLKSMFVKKVDDYSDAKYWQGKTSMEGKKGEKLLADNGWESRPSKEDKKMVLWSNSSEPKMSIVQNTNVGNFWIQNSNKQAMRTYKKKLIIAIYS
jgi:hypothetical protein